MLITEVLFYQKAAQAIVQLDPDTSNANPEKVAGVFVHTLVSSFGQFAAKQILSKVVAKEDSKLVQRIVEVFRVFNPEEHNSVSPLQAYMEPYIQAEAVEVLWSALSTHPELNKLMAGVVFSTKLLESADQKRDFLNKHKELLQKVTNLDLSKKRLRAIPAEIRYCTKLQTLDISNNRLKELPLPLFELKNLKILKAKYNLLTQLPAEIAELRQLENLQLYENELQKLPEEVGKLIKLKMFNLANNQLQALPSSICNCTSLIYLYLDNNQLTDLPKELNKLESLYALYLHGNKIALLPDAVFQLQNLTSLCLSNNNLNSLPDSFGNMSKLRFFWLSNNNLKELPKSIGELSALNYFSIDGNQIAELPDEMEYLKLMHFSFFGNKIKKVPALLGNMPFWSLDPHLYPRVEMIGRPCLNQSMAPQQFSDVYWKLGQNKWKEAVDGIHHQHGRDVYDRGLHAPTNTEPGYMASMLNAFQYLAQNFNRPLDADFYLETHQKACSHFKGAQTATWIDINKVGVFRNENDTIKADLGEGYELDPKVIQEFYELNGKLQLLFGSSFFLGDLVSIDEGSDKVRIKYHTMSAEQVRIIFNYFVTEFYYEIGHAKNEDEKLTAIARWFQYNEWLHPPVDGCGRTDLAFLNYLLTSYGFNPTLLQLPYVSSCRRLEEWVEKLKEGIKAWQQA